jgi:hypothetical protein
VHKRKRPRRRSGQGRSYRRAQAAAAHRPEGCCTRPRSARHSRSSICQQSPALPSHGSPCSNGRRAHRVQATATHYWAGDEFERLANLVRYGTLGIPERAGFRFSYIDDRVPWLDERADYYQGYDIVIGRVQIYGAVLHQRPPDKPAQLKCWRAESALIEALYV